MDEGFDNFTGLREAIDNALKEVEGVNFLSINYEGSPDPYLFDDPDNLPEGVE